MPASAQNAPILLVDDDEQVLGLLKNLLVKKGFGEIVTFSDSRTVVPYLEQHEAGAIVLDLFMPGVSGRKLLQTCAACHPDVPVIILTGAGDIETAIDCMKDGACDFLVKPIDFNKLISSTRRALELRALNRKILNLNNSPLQDQLCCEANFSRIITHDPQMRRLFGYMEVIAPSRQPVLITGETGVGKELFAHAIHSASEVAGAFVAINVAGLDDQMFSDTLFGHEKGAFTGAITTRDGLISKAAGGTLFLDEIGDLPDTSQIKLLRLIQEQEYYRLGADTPLKCSARLVIATHRNLKKEMTEGTFRKDLYYRLSTHQIAIPPLRERLDDIPLLLDHFISTAAKSMGKAAVAYPRELVTLLAAYDFPGNVRELQALAFDSVSRSNGRELNQERFLAVFKEEREPLPYTPATSSPADSTTSGTVSFNHFPTLKEAETTLIALALEMAGGNQGIAASLLGISRQALNNRLRRNPD